MFPRKQILHINPKKAVHPHVLSLLYELKSGYFPISNPYNSRSIDYFSLVSFLKLIHSMRRQFWAITQVSAQSLIFLYSRLTPWPSRSWGGRIPGSKKSEKNSENYLAQGTTLVQVRSLNSKKMFFWYTPAPYLLFILN